MFVRFLIIFWIKILLKGIKAVDDLRVEKNERNRLTYVRTSQKLSQEIVAADLGITQKTLSNYEHQKRSPSIPMMKKIAKYYNKDIIYLFFED